MNVQELGPNLSVIAAVLVAVGSMILAVFGFVEGKVNKALSAQKESYEPRVKSLEDKVALLESQIAGFRAGRIAATELLVEAISDTPPPSTRVIQIINRAIQVMQ